MCIRFITLLFYHLYYISCSPSHLRCFSKVSNSRNCKPIAYTRDTYVKNVQRQRDRNHFGIMFFKLMFNLLPSRMMTQNKQPVSRLNQVSHTSRHYRTPTHQCCSNKKIVSKYVAKNSHKNILWKLQTTNMTTLKMMCQSKFMP